MSPSTVVISSEALSQDIGGECVILDLASSCYFGLDEVGARCWRLLQDNTDLRAVCDVLLSEYDVEGDRLVSDINKLIAQLADAGLVTAT